MSSFPSNPDSSQVWRPTLYTFGAVFLSILLVGALVGPALLGFAERVYLDLVNDVNERQARAMTAFLQARLASGLSAEETVREFQTATADSEIDRGYVCLIEQDSTRYLSHPNLEQLGMDVKPGARFDPANGQEQAPWTTFIRRGAAANGHLSYGPNMVQERVYFTPVPGTPWVLSTHENLARIHHELSRLRRWLIAGSVLLSLLVALPASAAARGVSQRREVRIRREADLERRLLKEENARTSFELEQARHLQLSLLPLELPKRPEADFGARMETATEVGGDFYDALERQDGSLLLAIGDATGHGLKAGMMAVAAKSLFARSVEADDLVAATQGMARALRRMRLGRLNMAFALARLSGRVLEVVGAGMPPALIHRQVDGQIEELALSGAPLGSPIDYPYSLRRVDLRAGDTVLFMSDGLPELRAESGEELGYARAAALFRATLGRAREANEIVDILFAEARAWSGGELDDDVTLLALRIT